MQYDELDISFKELEKVHQDTSSKLLAASNMLMVKEDVEQQLAMVTEHRKQIDEAKDGLKNELEAASGYIEQLEQKFYDSKLTSLDLLRSLKDGENEIDVLKTYIIDLKSRIAVYIPVKGDATDKKMAEYINNYPDRQKLKIMFMRESEGVYQFGTKRIGVKVAKDKIEIRVGGGFLSIDEFLDQYTPAELEKLERKDPLKR